MHFYWNELFAWYLYTSFWFAIYYIRKLYKISLSVFTILLAKLLSNYKSPSAEMLFAWLLFQLNIGKKNSSNQSISILQTFCPLVCRSAKKGIICIYIEMKISWLLFKKRVWFFFVKIPPFLQLLMSVCPSVCQV